MILTHDPNNRVCIQIGLGTKAEYIYLAHPQWRELRSKQKPLKQIPDAFCDPNDNRCWHYYGIDAALTSILFCSARYSLLSSEQKKYVSWICTAITNSQDFHTSNYLGLKNHSLSYTPKISWDRKIFDFSFKIFCDWITQKLRVMNQQISPLILGAPFDWIIQKLGIKEIDVLAVDIEGFESILFANYSWNIRPKFIAIEYHDELNHLSGIPIGVDFAAREEVMGNELAELIQSQGYQLICREPTNYRSKRYAKTLELQFLRDDLCD